MYEAHQLPPMQCQAQIMSIEDRERGWGVARPHYQYEAAIAGCFEGQPGYEATAMAYRHSAQEEAEEYTSTDHSVSTETLVAAYSAGQAIGAATNNSSPSYGSTNEAAAAAASAAYGASSASQSAYQSSAQPSSSGSAARHQYQQAEQCVLRDRSSNSLADFWVNRCSFPVFVTWIDGRECVNGCGAGPIQPGDKESTTKADGSITFVACEYPGHARTMDGVQWRGGNYKCE
ncbi:hypothetical protein P3W53_06945 [Pseudomonas denitrificans (nom. rej.)]|nr:hypothetical protein [Pseudomonas denitrificans (nom. rej.)]